MKYIETEAQINELPGRNMRVAQSLAQKLEEVQEFRLNLRVRGKGERKLSRTAWHCIIRRQFAYEYCMR